MFILFAFSKLHCQPPIKTGDRNHFTFAVVLTPRQTTQVFVTLHTCCSLSSQIWYRTQPWPWKGEVVAGGGGGFGGGGGWYCVMQWNFKRHWKDFLPQAGRSLEMWVSDRFASFCASPLMEFQVKIRWMIRENLYVEMIVSCNANRKRKQVSKLSVFWSREQQARLLLLSFHTTK